MNRTLFSPLALALGLALAIPTVTVAQQVTPITSPNATVTVELGDFDTMSELKHMRGNQRRDTERQIESLAKWLAKRAEGRLPQGQTLAITLQDVDLAGDIEPGRGPNMRDVRVVREIYPPQIELSWNVSDAAGATVDEGQDTLRDLGFLTTMNLLASDPQRYEKRMLDKWLRERFPNKP